MEPEAREGQKLEGWKGIAEFLGVTVRTAQNWERYLGMPIQRRGSGNGARVSADRAELGIWKAGLSTSKPNGFKRWVRRVLGWRQAR